MLLEGEGLYSIHHFLQIRFAQFTHGPKQDWNLRLIQRPLQLIRNAPGGNKGILGRFKLQDLSQTKDCLVRGQSALPVQDATQEGRGDPGLFR